MLILLRHGQSMWNQANLFTGCIDIPLSKEGIVEAQKAGKKIKSIPIDTIFTSNLIRAEMTAMIAMSEHDFGKTPEIIHDEDESIEKESKNWGDTSKIIPVYRSKYLNERMYGHLQGLNKQETMDKYGKEQVQIWRRSFDVPPPGGESLKMTKERTIPFFLNKVMPFIEKGKNVLITAHGNSLRSIVMNIENLNEQEILKYEIETGKPLFYRWSQNQFTKIL